MIFVDMSEQRSSYRQIFKATSIFGGVQVYQIGVTLVRSKLVAVLLGTQGMGVSGMFLSVTTLISGITGMGISTSAVRNVAEANQSANQERIAYVVQVVKKLALLTGGLAAVLVLVLSYPISLASFGSYAFATSFMLLSLTFILNSLAAGQSILFQGLRRLKLLTTTTVAGATAGLLISIPLYYWWGIDGIVPALILTAAVNALVAVWLGRQIELPETQVSFRESLREGKEMIRMGIAIGLNGIIAAATGYLLRVFISHQGGVGDVGLYSAGFAILNTYVGMVFTAMGTDYYPRLSAVARDNEKANQLVNQQAEIALLILGPLLLFLFIILEYAIALLYSVEFLGCVGMVQWAIFAILLKAMTWSMGFLFLANGNGKLFFWNELVANIYALGISVLAYDYMGLDGLGLAFLVSFVISTIQNLALVYHLYKFSISKALWFTLLIHGVLGMLCVMTRIILSDHLFYICTGGLFLVSLAFSFFHLNRLLELREWFSRITKGSK